MVIRRLSTRCAVLCVLLALCCLPSISCQLLLRYANLETFSLLNSNATNPKLLDGSRRNLQDGGEVVGTGTNSPQCGADGSGLNHNGDPCKYPYVPEVSRNKDGYIDHTISGAKLTNGIYPSTTLSCYSSYTKPDGMLICPEARSKFCVKELSTLKQDLCGQSQYFGDQYLENLCVLRKCAAECTEGQYPFSYGGLVYVRVRYCCQENYCNSSPRSIASATLLVSASVLVLSVLLMFL